MTSWSLARPELNTEYSCRRHSEYFLKFFPHPGSILFAPGVFLPPYVLSSLGSPQSSTGFAHKSLSFAGKLPALREFFPHRSRRRQRLELAESNVVAMRGSQQFNSLTLVPST